MCFGAAAASVTVAFWYFWEADFSAAAAFDGDLGFVNFSSAMEAVGEVVLCELVSSAAAAIDGDFALDELHSVLEVDGEVGHSIASRLAPGQDGRTLRATHSSLWQLQLKISGCASQPTLPKRKDLDTHTLYSESHLALLVRSLTGETLVFTSQCPSSVSVYLDHGRSSESLLPHISG